MASMERTKYIVYLYKSAFLHVQVPGHDICATFTFIACLCRLLLDYKLFSSKFTANVTNCYVSYLNKRSQQINYVISRRDYALAQMAYVAMFQMFATSYIRIVYLCLPFVNSKALIILSYGACIFRSKQMVIPSLAGLFFTVFVRRTKSQEGHTSGLLQRCQAI